MPRLALPLEIPSDNDVPKTLIGYVSVQGQKSVFSGESTALQETAKAYHAKKKDRDDVRHDLEKSGFTIIAESPLGFSVSAPGDAFEEITGGTLQARERLTTVDPNNKVYVTHIDIVGDNQPATLGVGRAASESLRVDGILIEKPRVYQQVFPSPIPPSSPKFHLRLPDDVALALNATAAHQRGERGAGVSIAMPDSGQYRHPFLPHTPMRSGARSLSFPEPARAGIRSDMAPANPRISSPWLRERTCSPFAPAIMQAIWWAP